MNRKNFCLYPFSAFSLDNAGKQRICCNNDGWAAVEKNKNFNDPSFDILEQFNNPFHKEVRKYMIEDQRHPSCKKCWEIEDEGQISWREWFNESFQLSTNYDYWIEKCDVDGTINSTEFLYLDITFGNRCNLKCVMCNGYNSTLFLKEQYDTNQISKVEYNNLIKLDWFEDDKCFEKLYQHVKNVQRIHILGGEPLIIEHQEFLKKIIDLGLSKNIILSYNSNLTKTPSEILECWKEFKQVYLCVSVDAYGILNEFIRYPMSWDKLCRNLEIVDNAAHVHKNIIVQIHSTVSALNCGAMIELIDWVQNMSKIYKSIDPCPMFNYVYSPYWFDPIHLPYEIKKKSYDQYIAWESENAEFLKECDNRQRFDMLKSYFEKILKSSDNSQIYKLCLEKIKFFERIRKIKFPSTIGN